MKKNLLTKRILTLFLLLSLLMTACGSKETPKASPANEAIISFTDDCGRTINIPEKVSRIVPSGPIAQIMLFALAPDLIVGLSDKWNDSASGIIKEEYMSLPYFGHLYASADLNVEELALAAPQLIIDVGEGKGSVADDMDTLELQTGIPSVHFDSNLETAPDTFRRLGKLLGREEKAEELAAFYEKSYNNALDICKLVGDKKVRAIYVPGAEGTSILAKNSYHSELIDLLTDNVAVIDTPSDKGLGNEVTLEQIALWNPDFIIFGPDSIYDEAAEKDIWKDLPAIKAGNYVQTPSVPYCFLGTPPAAQRVLGLIWLPSILYPEYSDIDLKGEITEFYRLFYDCELTDEMYDTIMYGAERR